MKPPYFKRDYSIPGWLDSDGNRYNENFRRLPEDALMTECTTDEAEALLNDNAPTAWFDVITNPAHYTKDRSIEPIDVIDDWALDFNLGQVIKYVARAGRKGSKAVDLEKAEFYLRRAIDRALDK